MAGSTGTSSGANTQQPGQLLGQTLTRPTNRSGFDVVRPVIQVPGLLTAPSWYTSRFNLTIALWLESRNCPAPVPSKQTGDHCALRRPRRLVRTNINLLSLHQLSRPTSILLEWFWGGYGTCSPHQQDGRCTIKRRQAHPHWTLTPPSRFPVSRVILGQCVQKSPVSARKSKIRKTFDET